MSSRIEFGFRVWVHPEDGDPPEIEVWFQGLEPTESGRCYASDWARDSLSNEDFHDLFELDKTKHWQVVGKGTLQGHYEYYGDYYGDYNENLDVIEYEIAEVPKSWYDREHLPSSTISEDQLIAFGKWCLEETKCAIVEGCFDLDAEAFADKSAELGLIEKAAYNPEKHHDSGDVPFEEGDVPPIQKEAAEEIERLEGLIRWHDDHGFFLAYDNSDPPQLWVWRGEPEDETAEPWQRVLSSEEVDV